jgi:hypothetical protein
MCTGFIWLREEGQGRADVNTGVNFPVTQKTVCPGLCNWWGGCCMYSSAIFTSLHFNSRNGKSVARLKNLIVLSIINDYPINIRKLFKSAIA